MVRIPEDLRYTKEHEWARLEGSDIRIGITDYAQNELTDIVYVELPKVGDHRNKGDELATVESVKSTSPVYAPAAGSVAAVNKDLESSPDLVNKDPYGKGWIVLLRPKDKTDLGGLLSAAEYRKHVESVKHH